MILMGIINKDYYLQLIRNKKTFQPLNPLRSYEQIVAKSNPSQFWSLKYCRPPKHWLKNSSPQKYFAAKIFRFSELGKTEISCFDSRNYSKNNRYYQKIAYFFFWKKILPRITLFVSCRSFWSRRSTSRISHNRSDRRFRWHFSLDCSHGQHNVFIRLYIFYFTSNVLKCP